MRIVNRILLVIIRSKKIKSIKKNYKKEYFCTWYENLFGIMYTYYFPSRDYVINNGVVAPLLALVKPDIKIGYLM